MTKFVKYVGKTDQRILTGADFAQAGVEGIDKDFTFFKGEEVKVINKVAKALQDNGELFGSFEVSDEPSEDDEESESDTGSGSDPDKNDGEPAGKGNINSHPQISLGATGTPSTGTTGGSTRTSTTGGSTSGASRS